jgi:hypothetical protein
LEKTKFEFPPLPSPPLNDKLLSKLESLKNNRVEEIEDDDEEEWSKKIDKACGKYNWGIKDEGVWGD